jgi:hypothetical protein
MNFPITVMLTKDYTPSGVDELEVSVSVLWCFERRLSLSELQQKVPKQEQRSKVQWKPTNRKLEETGAVRQRHLSQPEAGLQWYGDWNS